MDSSSTWSRVKFLGKGSSGFVHLASHRHKNFLFAVKRANLERSSSLVKEKRILENFGDCKEIIDCYGSELTVEDDQTVYNLFIEYASGGTLLDLINSSGGCITAESDVRSYTRMILKALRRIHAEGFVHCDIKPENVLVFPTEHAGKYQLKISDFGVAKEPNEVTLNRFRGTMSYMSPGSVRGEIKASNDIWSLGCVLIEMITGRSGWPKLDLEEMMYVLTSTEEMPEIPERMSEIGKDFLRKCFERDAQRSWSADMLLNHPYITSDQPDVDAAQYIEVLHKLKLTNQKSTPQKILKRNKKFTF